MPTSPFDPFVNYALWKVFPEERCSLKEIVMEIQARQALGLFLNRIWSCLNVEELKAELERQWEPSKPYPEYRVRLKQSYDRRKAELGGI